MSFLFCRSNNFVCNSSKKRRSNFLTFQLGLYIIPIPIQYTVYWYYPLNILRSTYSFNKDNDITLIIVWAENEFQRRAMGGRRRRLSSVCRHGFIARSFFLLSKRKTFAPLLQLMFAVFSFILLFASRPSFALKYKFILRGFVRYTVFIVFRENFSK